MKNMTAKDLHIAVKNQATEEDLMIRYGINSSEELYDLMSKVSPGNLEHFKREIKKNQKSRSRKESRKEAAVLEQQKEDTEQIRVATQEGFMNQTESTNSENLPGQNSADENGKIGKTIVEGVTVEEPINDEPKLSLEELMEEEKFLSDNCVALEKEHNELISARREDVKMLANIKRTLEELKRLLQANQNRLTTVLEDYNSKAEQMIRVNSEISACKEMLADTRAQIEEAKKLKISVFADGIIECDNGKLEYPAETEVQQLISILVLMKEAEELTVRQIKTAAYLILVVKGIDQKYELEFDNDLVKKLYEAAIA